MVSVKTSLTLDKELVDAVDAERDKYTSRSLMITKCLDIYFENKELLTLFSKLDNEDDRQKAIFFISKLPNNPKFEE